MRKLTQTTRVSRSPYTGRPILQELNTVYGYWATARFLTEEERAELNRLPEYDGPRHPAEERYIQACTTV